MKSLGFNRGHTQFRAGVSRQRIIAETAETLGTIGYEAMQKIVGASPPYSDEQILAIQEQIRQGANNSVAERFLPREGQTEESNQLSGTFSLPESQS